MQRILFVRTSASLRPETVHAFGDLAWECNVANGVVATRKERNAIEVSHVVSYTQNMVRHSSMSAKEWKAPTHTTIHDSPILYIGSFGFQIPLAESSKEDIKPNFRMPPL